jgi:hypothetical protein
MRGDFNRRTFQAMFDTLERPDRIWWRVEGVRYLFARIS